METTTIVFVGAGHPLNGQGGKETKFRETESELIPVRMSFCSQKIGDMA